MSHSISPTSTRLIAVMLLPTLVAVSTCQRAGVPETTPHRMPDSVEATLHPTAAWVLSCQNQDGGFGAFPGDISTVRDTSWALESLERLAVPFPRPSAIVEFVRSRQNADGGFRGRPWGTRWAERSTLIDSYHGVNALLRLEESIPSALALRDFVVSRQRDDGGFLQEYVPDYPFTSATTEQTYYAVSLLLGLDAEVPNRERVVAFLQRMQSEQVRGDGGFFFEDVPEWEPLYTAAQQWADSVEPYRPPGPDQTRAIPVSVSYTASTGFAVATLDLLEVAQVDGEAIRTFLAGQQDSSGGFLTGMGDYGAYQDRSDGRMLDTEWALAGLRTIVGDRDWNDYLGGAPFDRERLLAWVRSCQNANGGFARRPDPMVRPSDMRATAGALHILAVLSEPIPRPASPVRPMREVLPEGVELGEPSVYFQPDQPGQALYVHRLVSPIRAAHPDDDEAAALALMDWLNRALLFGASTRRESALIYEHGFGNCGNQSLALVGLLEALGIRARFIEVEGHNVCEAFLNERWVLLDPMFNGAFRRPDGGLYSALDVHDRHRQGESEVTTFGDFRYATFTVYWHDGLDEREITIGPEDDQTSEAARRAYPIETR